MTTGPLRLPLMFPSKPSRPGGWPSRCALADYLELVKPRIAAMVLLTVTVGFTLGSGGTWHVARTGQCPGRRRPRGGGQRRVQPVDRTAHRRPHGPHGQSSAAGRPAHPIEVAGFGLRRARRPALPCCFVGSQLRRRPSWRSSRSPCTCRLHAAQAVHGPEHGRRRHSRCTAPRAWGGRPRAVPSAGRPFRCLRSCSSGSSRIFWRSPGSIGTITRRPACGCCPADLPRKGLTGLSACVYAAVLIPVSVMPGQVALAGGSYRVAALLLGLGYLAAALRFFVNESRETARGLLYVSLVYLPVLLSVLTWDHIRLR